MKLLIVEDHCAFGRFEAEAEADELGERQSA